MKVAILTFVRAYNYGAVLQCYALQQVLDQLGTENEVLDYYPAYFKELYSFAYLGNMRYFPYRPINNWIKYTPLLYKKNKRIAGFEKFISEDMRMSSKVYHSAEDLDKEETPYDIFVVGSDQVWSNLWTEFDRTFFLDFNGAENKKKVSYAASFGFTKIPEGLFEEYKRRLTGWDKYSVREESGIELVKQLIGEDALRCCDPTLLLDKKEWEKLVDYKKYNNKKYIVIYYVNQLSDDLLKAAQTIALKENLNIYITTSMATYEDIMAVKAKTIAGKSKGEASPKEFLSLIANAHYVLTDSFHGTVFSILFHRHFLAKIEGESRKNVRIDELLRTLGLNQKLENGIEQIKTKIDWESVDERIEEYRDKSIMYLKSINDLI